jgi:hypothetical protein
MKLKSAIMFIVFVLLSFGCDDKILDQNADGLSDEQLIKSIQFATDKEKINREDLPGECKISLERDYYDCYVENAMLAPGLGYELEISTGSGAFTGDIEKKYFNLKGRELRHGKGRGKDDRGSKDGKKCFTLVLPVSFMLPDGSIITVEDKDDWGEIKNWYKAHPDTKERPVPQFPLDIIFADGTTVTLNSHEELGRIHESCRESRGEDGGDQERCFELVYPVTFIMPDGTEMKIESREDMPQLRDWYTDNPDAEGRPDIQFPVDIVFKDGTVITITSSEELLGAYARCGDDKGRRGGGKHGGRGNRP